MENSYMYAAEFQYYDECFINKIFHKEENAQAYVDAENKSNATRPYWSVVVIEIGD